MSDHINRKGMSLEGNGYNFRFRGITFTTRTFLLSLAKCNKIIHFHIRNQVFKYFWKIYSQNCYYISLIFETIGRFPMEIESQIS